MIEEIVLDSKEEVKNISYEYSSSFWGEGATEYAFLKLMDGPHSKYLSALYLEDVMRIHIPRKIVDCGEKRIIKVASQKLHLHNPTGI